MTGSRIDRRVLVFAFLTVLVLRLLALGAVDKGSVHAGWLNQTIPTPTPDRKDTPPPPEPTEKPTEAPPDPTETPPEPTPEPTEELPTPTDTPTDLPTDEPTEAPPEPTESPPGPSPAPTATPPESTATLAPTATASSTSEAPALGPTPAPTLTPSPSPTVAPSATRTQPLSTDMPPEVTPPDGVVATPSALPAPIGAPAVQRRAGLVQASCLWVFAGLILIGAGVGVLIWRRREP